MRYHKDFKDIITDVEWHSDRKRDKIHTQHDIEKPKNAVFIGILGLFYERP